MKNINQEGLNELSQQEVVQIEGGKWANDIIGDFVDWTKRLLS